MIENIPASLMKQYPGMKTYLSLDEAGICQIGKRISSTVTSHYYKGLSNHLDNLVIVCLTENREQRTENREQRTENREIIILLFIMATIMDCMMDMMALYLVLMDYVRQLQHPSVE